MWPLRNEQSSVAVSQRQLSGDEAARTEKGRCVRGDVKMFNFLFLSYMFRANWLIFCSHPPPLAKPKRSGGKSNKSLSIESLTIEVGLRRLASFLATQRRVGATGRWGYYWIIIWALWSIFPTCCRKDRDRDGVSVSRLTLEATLGTWSLLTVVYFLSWLRT